jgi:restriction system protein
MALLVETLIRINPRKRDVISFFRGAGVTSSRLSDWAQRLQAEPQSVRKADIVRDVLQELNENKGNDALRLRREVVRRVVQFEEFSACWESDRLQAQGLVAQLRSLVNAKDTLTQINIERERERAERLQESAERAKVIAATKAAREAVKRDLFALFAESDSVKRGLALEPILNRLFDTYGILVRDAFRRQGDPGEGTVEQVDGVIELDGHIYLVEVKWHASDLGVALVGPHLVRVFGRADVRGLIISNSGYTPAAIAEVRTALRDRVIILCQLSELVFLLDNAGDLRAFLRKKAHAAQIDKQPFVSVS